MTRDKLIEIINDYFSWNGGKGDYTDQLMSHSAGLADAIIAAGPVASDEMMARLRSRDALYRRREYDTGFAGGKLVGWLAALHILGLLDAVKEQA